MYDFIYSCFLILFVCKDLIVVTVVLVLVNCYIESFACQQSSVVVAVVLFTINFSHFAIKHVINSDCITGAGGATGNRVVASQIRRQIPLIVEQLIVCIVDTFLVLFSARIGEIRACERAVD